MSLLGSLIKRLGACRQCGPLGSAVAIPDFWYKYKFSVTVCTCLQSLQQINSIQRKAGNTSSKVLVELIN